MTWLCSASAGVGSCASYPQKPGISTVLARSGSVIAATRSRARASSPSVGPQPVGASGSTDGVAEADGEVSPSPAGAAARRRVRAGEQPASRASRASATAEAARAGCRLARVVLIAVHCVIRRLRWPGGRPAGAARPDRAAPLPVAAGHTPAVTRCWPPTRRHWPPVTRATSTRAAGCSSLPPASSPTAAPAAAAGAGTAPTSTTDRPVRPDRLSRSPAACRSWTASAWWTVPGGLWMHRWMRRWTTAGFRGTTDPHLWTVLWTRKLVEIPPGKPLWGLPSAH